MRKFSVVSVGTLLAVGLVVAGTAGTAGASSRTPKPPVSTVKSVVPDHGPTTGGTTVTIRGKNLITATAVDFGSAAASSFTLRGQAVVAISPAEVAGTVDIRVTTADGETAISSADQFTFESDLPTIENIAPRSGATIGGNKVTIVGANLGDAFEVDFGANPSPSVVVDSSKAISAVAPPGAVGTVTISVKTPAGTTPSDPSDLYTYRIEAPKVTSISPENGPVGTSVTVTGSGFSHVTGVSFGSTPASFTVTNGKSITATAPSGSGTVHVTVTNAKGTSSAGAVDQFTYTT